MMPGKRSLQNKSGRAKIWVWWQEVELNALEGQLDATNRSRQQTPSRSRIQVWLIRLSTSILLWTCIIQLITLAQLWHPQLLKGCPPCILKEELAENGFSNLSVTADASVGPLVHTVNYVVPSPRKYKSNGYLLVSCNGGLNQMRAAICDMVAVATYLNLTLVIPELDKTSFWADPSDFGDIFDVKHFMTSLRDELRIVKEVPEKYHKRVRQGAIVSLQPISWSNESYYLKQIFPLIQKHKVLHFSKTDARLANSGLPLSMQKLRCRVNYEALHFTPHIELLGRRLVRMLRANGPFLVLHLRYEMDMLAFSGCTHGCTEAETKDLTRMRYAYPWWKEKIIDSEQKRQDGLCPLTPEEATLVLKALGIEKEMQIYIAAGEIYGSNKRMAALYAAFPNTAGKEMLLTSKDLESFQNRSSQMAAIDYLVALESDVFIPTYDGNMAKLVEGHRRYLGYKRSILLDRRRLVQLIDQYQNNTLQWDEFSLAVRHAHENRIGAPTPRLVIPEKPKEEDYFYANPQECLSA